MATSAARCSTRPSPPSALKAWTGLTLREIGARVGVSRTALYRHFADKRALLSAVATEGFRTLRLQLAAAWDESGRGRAGFETMGGAYVRFAVANPSHYRVMFGGFVDSGAGVRARVGDRGCGSVPSARRCPRRAAARRLRARRRYGAHGPVRVGGGPRRGDARHRWPAASARRRRGTVAVYARERLRTGIGLDPDHLPAQS